MQSTIGPGLERDCRQDQFPARYAEQDEFPTACSSLPRTIYIANPGNSVVGELDQQPVLIEDEKLSESAKNVEIGTTSSCRFRKRTVRFTVFSIGFLVVMGVVLAAYYLGSKVALRDRLSGSELKSNFTISSSSASSSPTPLPTNALSSSSSSSQVPMVESLQQPRFDCPVIPSPYTVDIDIKKIGNKIPSTTETRAQFDIFCNTGFNGGNFMTFYSPSLITCINGCANFNYWQIMNGNIGMMNCSGVKYGLNSDSVGNCYLKSGGYQTVMFHGVNMTYARLRK